MSVIAQLHFIFISTFIFSLPFDFNGFSGILEGSTLVDTIYHETSGPPWFWKVRRKYCKETY